MRKVPLVFEDNKGCFLGEPYAVYRLPEMNLEDLDSMVTFVESNLQIQSPKGWELVEKGPDYIYVRKVQK